jgi:hypothetical protein
LVCFVLLILAKNVKRSEEYSRFKVTPWTVSYISTHALLMPYALKDAASWEAASQREWEKWNRPKLNTVLSQTHCICSLKNSPWPTNSEWKTKCLAIVRHWAVRWFVIKPYHSNKWVIYKKTQCKGNKMRRFNVLIITLTIPISILVSI